MLYSRKLTNKIMLFLPSSKMNLKFKSPSVAATNLLEEQSRTKHSQLPRDRGDRDTNAGPGRSLERDGRLAPGGWGGLDREAPTSLPDTVACPALKAHPAPTAATGTRTVMAHGPSQAHLALPSLRAMGPALNI